MAILNVMANRKSKTTIDYVIIAINPTLIVFMITSLVYFLTLCFYRGDLLNRMNYILALFVVAAVGIARIAIEQGRAKASAYAVALGGATLFSISSFIGDGIGLAVVLLIVIWVMADRITIDCTVIDEEKDASGEGLMQGGLFGGARRVQSQDVSLDGTTSTGDPSQVEASAGADQVGVVKRAKRKLTSTHRPGMWILYLALGAFPLYGLGQVMLPNEVATAAALKSLGIYLASSLMLLVTTSFLGMRRYLRQRGVDMPAGISVNWLGVGAVLVVGLLVVCFLLPQPGKMLASVDFSALDDSDDLSASRYGWGSEGVRSGDENAAQAPEGQEPNPDGPPGNDDQGEAAPSEDGRPGSKGSGNPEGQQGGGDGEEKSDESSGGNQQGDKSEGGSENSQNDGSQKGNQHSQQKKGDSQSSEQQSDQQEQSGSDDTQQQSDDNPFSSEEDESGSASETPPPQSSSSSMPTLPPISGFLKFLIVAILVGIIAFYAFKHWDEIRRWLRELFAGFEEDEEESSAPGQGTDPMAAAARQFKEFRCPLEDRSISLEQCVVITFSAVDAWAKERGRPRDVETTPSEFTKELANQYPEQSTNLPLLADMYNLVIYGNRRVNEAHRTTLQSIWAFMNENQQSPPVASASESFPNEPELVASAAPSATTDSPPAPPQRWK